MSWDPCEARADYAGLIDWKDEKNVLCDPGFARRALVYFRRRKPYVVRRNPGTA